MAHRQTHSFTLDTRGPRLQKVLSEAGYGSRRACEELIEAGSVTVNREVVNALPAWVDPKADDIRVHGKRLKPPERHVYVMLFKPRGVVSTNSDPEGRTRAIDLVKHPGNPRLYPVGRLDLDSSGLLLLTNDGELANRLTHPRYEIHKGYEVTVGGALTDADVRFLEEGIFARDRAGPRGNGSRLTIVKRDRTRTLLHMELREEGNRPIRTMLQRVGHPVKKLRRVSMGSLVLKGLAVGEWRNLTPVELRTLRAAAFGETPADAARPEAHPIRKKKSTRPNSRPARGSSGDTTAKRTETSSLAPARKAAEPPRQRNEISGAQDNRSRGGQSSRARDGRSGSPGRSARPESRTASRGGRSPQRRSRDRRG